MSVEAKKECQAWPIAYKNLKLMGKLKPAPRRLQKMYDGRYDVDKTLNRKVSLWRGDITKLKVDAIVNAANEDLAAGGGICGAIHKAAGMMLAEECAIIGYCATGNTVATGAYELPCEFVLHTVGPKGELPAKLESCYRTILDLCVEKKIRSVAIPCISTGIYGFPNATAAFTALETVRKWLSTGDNAKNFDKIIFCVFLEVDHIIYTKCLPLFFPVDRRVT